MNGGTLASIVLGGTNDSNPEFTANQTNVYGSASSGFWLVSIPVTGNLTASGGTDAVNIAATTTSNFDGRIVYASLWEVYQNPSLSNQFQYAVGEGNGDIYNSLPNNAPGGVTTSASRLLDLGGVNASDAQAASLATLYDYVHSAQDNKLFLSDATGDDNTLLGGDPAVSSAGTYAAATASFALTAGGLSSSDNWFKFSVDPNDGVALSSGGDGSNVLRPQLAILEVTHRSPKPAHQIACWRVACRRFAIATIRRRKATSRMNRRSQVIVASVTCGPAQLAWGGWYIGYQPHENRDRNLREVVDMSGRNVRLPKRPARMLSQCTSATDTIVALGLADRLIAIDEFGRVVPGTERVAVVGKGSPST